jgi:hypothetical protein
MFQGGPADPYLARARQAADWLANNALQPEAHLFLTRYYLNEDDERFSAPYSFKAGITYSFDNGMIINGLMNLYRLTADPDHLAIAQNVAASVIEKMQMHDGMFHATYGIVQKKPLDETRVWSRHPGSHHAKLAIGLLELYRATKAEHFLLSANKVCEAALHYQHDSGRFEVFHRDRDTFTHYHLYSIEGLLYASQYYLGGQGEKFLNSAQLAFDWVLRKLYIQSTGGIAELYVNRAPVGIETADIIAQTLRLGAFIKSLGTVSQGPGAEITADGRSADGLSEPAIRSGFIRRILLRLLPLRRTYPSRQRLDNDVRHPGAGALRSRF